MELSGSAEISTANDPAGELDGCVDIRAGVDLFAGANADFFGLFHPGARASLLKKDFDLFQVCQLGVTTEENRANLFVR